MTVPTGRRCRRICNHIKTAHVTVALGYCGTCILGACVVVLAMAKLCLWRKTHSHIRRCCFLIESVWEKDIDREQCESNAATGCLDCSCSIMEPLRMIIA